MGRKEVLEKVTDVDLDQTVKAFEKAGAKVTKEKKEDGTWTITAVFPNGE
jgi:ABC-type uncharacterized transport system auxiliary subunit